MPDPTTQQSRTTNDQTEDGDVKRYGRVAIPVIALLLRKIDT